MIIVRLAGGLGNQIFQLGAGLLLANKHNINKIILDDSSLSSYKVKRKNELINFFDFDKSNIQIEFKKKWITKLRLPKFFCFNINNNIFVSDKNFQITLQYSKKKFFILDGYFQFILNQNDFNLMSKLLNSMNIKNYNNEIDNNSCVVHIRGGDFIKLGWNIITPKEYYLDAMQLMEKEYQIKNFIIITDDIEYAKTILGDYQFNYFFQNSSIENDFYTIQKYTKRILSSSTFSLWASMLGNNINSTVIAPKHWQPNKIRNIKVINEI